MGAEVDYIGQLAELVAKKTSSSFSSFHIDAAGLIRLGRKASECLEEFGRLILLAENLGGRLMVPTFSYSYANDDQFDRLKTPSEVGIVTEFLRLRHPEKRTIDGMFSYLAYGLPLGDPVFDFGNGLYESFGEDSLIARIYSEDGYICCVGDVFHNTPTEVHFLERRLKVHYRQDKTFSGIYVSGNFSARQNVTFFCRDLSLNLVSDMTRLEDSLRKNNLIEYWKVNSLDFYVEAVKIREIFELLKYELKRNPLFLCATPEEREENWKARSKKIRSSQ